MPPTIVTLWLPDGREHFLALIEQARQVARRASTQPVTSSVPSPSSTPSRNPNPGADPSWVAGGVMAYALRAVEGPA